MTNGQQPMQQMPMPQQPVQVKKGLSIAGMICGIVGIVFAVFIPCMFFIAWPLGILGIIFGGIGLSNANKNPNKEGKRMAITAIVLGVLSLIVPIITYFLIVATVESELTGLIFLL